MTKRQEPGRKWQFSLGNKEREDRNKEPKAFKDIPTEIQVAALL